VFITTSLPPRAIGSLARRPGRRLGILNRGVPEPPGGAPGAAQRRVQRREVRAAIANEGFAGLERLAKKYAIPVTLLVVGLGELAAVPGQGGQQ
jgi:hypothetical protein